MHVVAIRKEKEQSFDSDALAIGKERPESVRAQIGKPVHQHVETDGGGSFTLHPMCPLDDLVGLRMLVRHQLRVPGAPSGLCRPPSLDQFCIERDSSIEDL